MALYEDRVRLTIEDKTVDIYESYTIRCSIFKQPASFELKVGTPGSVENLVNRFGGHGRFSMQINNPMVQTGRLDGFTAGNQTGASELTLSGRDNLARLHDAFILHDTTFKHPVVFHQLVRHAMDAINFKDVGLIADNDQANRRVVTGARITMSKRPTVSIEEIQQLINDAADQQGAQPSAPVQPTKKVVYRSLKARAGERWYQFLKKELDRAGLFLWAGGDGGFILDTPTPYQPPVARLVRKIGKGKPGAANIETGSRVNNTHNRFTKCQVIARGGGRHAGRSKILGEYVDFEMAELLGGEESKPFVIYDSEVKTERQAVNLAQRTLSEFNRDAWQLNYTVAGHSVPSLLGAGRAVWSPNTVVDVDDDHFGIRGEFYVESVTFFSRPWRGTTLTLMRPEDLFFVSDAELAIPEVDLILD